MLAVELLCTQTVRVSTWLHAATVLRQVSCGIGALSEKLVGRVVSSQRTLTTKQLTVFTGTRILYIHSRELQTDGEHTCAADCAVLPFPSL